jgi:hypothetical protein
MMYTALFEISILARLGATLTLLLTLFGVVSVPTMYAATTRIIDVDSVKDSSPGDGCTLREAIDLANVGASAGPHANQCVVTEKGLGAPYTYVINVPSYTYTLKGASGEDGNVGGDLDIEANVIIVGEGAAKTIIDGDGADRVFHIDPGSDDGSFIVQIGNVTIRDGSASSAGGGVAVTGDNDTLYLASCVVYDNASTWNGGGIYNAGTLTITDSDVYSNTSSASAASGGGGIYNGGALTITDSDIYSNTLTGTLIYGSGIYNVGTLTVNGGSISGNEVRNESGGGLANEGVSHLTGVIIANNSALDTDGDDDSYGGGIYSWGVITITSCTIFGNEADDGGGGLYSASGLSGGGAAIITGTTIYSNTTSDASGDGGGINNAGALTITHSHILTNTASDNGGGIYSTGSFYIASSMVISNTAGGNGGGMRLQSDGGGTVATVITDTTVSRNTAANEGGGILLRAHEDSTITLALANSTISDNEANDYGGGLGVWLNHGGVADVALIESDITSNTVIFGAGGGVRIYASYTSTATVAFDRVTISDNEARIDGGGGVDIYSHDSVSKVRFENSTISGNETGGCGGGICSDDGIVTLNDSVISGNTSGDDGGGIYSDGGGAGAVENPLTLNSCTISGNTANSDSYAGGGGIYLYYSSVVMTNTTISGNSATATHGGGIGTLSDSDQTIDLAHCTIYSNTSGADGGGLFLEGSFTVNALHTIVAGNSASGGGPDIYGAIHSLDYNLIQDATDAVITGATAHDILGSDPLLGLLADNGGETWTHALLVGSPAIDAIPTISCTLTVDQRGVSRPQGSACDIGAYELAACYTLTTTVEPATGGSVSVNPPPDCGGDQYTVDTVVTLTAEANVGYAFDHWSGDAGGSVSPVTVTMDGDRDVTAHFVSMIYLPLIVRDASS